MVVAVGALKGDSQLKGGSGDERDSRRVHETPRRHHGAGDAGRLDGGVLDDVRLKRTGGGSCESSPRLPRKKSVAISRLLPAQLRESNRRAPGRRVPVGERNEWRQVFRR